MWCNLSTGSGSLCSRRELILLLLNFGSSEEFLKMIETSVTQNYLEDFSKEYFVLLGLLFKEMKILDGPRKPAKQVTLRSASRLY